MKTILIAAAMALAATPALGATQTRPFERTSVSHEARVSRDARMDRADLAMMRAGLDVPARQGDPADSLYRLGREAMNRQLGEPLSAQSPSALRPLMVNASNSQGCWPSRSITCRLSPGCRATRVRPPAATR